MPSLIHTRGRQPPQRLCAVPVSEWKTSPTHTRQAFSPSSRDARGSPHPGGVQPSTEAMKSGRAWMSGTSTVGSEGNSTMPPGRPLESRGRRVAASDSSVAFTFPTSAASSGPPGRLAVLEWDRLASSRARCIRTAATVIPRPRPRAAPASSRRLGRWGRCPGLRGRSPGPPPDCPAARRSPPGSPSL